MLTQERLKELLHYDPDTGLFTWKVAASNRAPAGAVAGCQNNQGYIQICVDGVRYLAHRLAFLYINGAFPSAEVDHIDNCRRNNRWSNIRPATTYENKQNASIRADNASGFKGVGRHGLSGKWQARASLNHKRYHLGLHPTAEAASAAYEAFARKHHGEFCHQTSSPKFNTDWRL